ncbi:MAG: hypothetical protein PHS59_03770 [Paludibacter sp.]|nr:hypothetical protein [Paludibacter sp.]
MNKNNILSWLVVLLLILNITTITTIVIHNYRENNDGQNFSLGSDGQNMLNGRYMRQVVGFDNEQMGLFRSAKHEFQPTANQIINSIDSIKTEMFRELNNNQTDTNKLNNLSDKIGSLHADLKKETNGFYLTIKSICRPEQQEKLKEVFTPLFRNVPENCTSGNRNGMGSGKGFRNQ